MGSKAYVQRAWKESRIDECHGEYDALGLNETEIRVSHADPKLVRIMEVAAAAVKLPVSGVNVDDVGSTDSESFRQKKIPAITIHSLTSDTLRILHSPRDRIEVVK